MSERQANDTSTPARVVAEVYVIDPVTKKPMAPGASASTYAPSTDPTAGVRGGSYIWAVTASAWNSATVKLQALGPDGATYLDIDSLTANGTKGVVIGEGATVRLAVSGGVPAGLASSLT